jgi:hypothetical protein
MSAQLAWPKNQITLNFAAGATIPSASADGVVNASGYVSLNQVGALTIVCPAEFNGDVLTLKSSVSGDTGFTITAATGHNRLTSDQIISISTMPDLLITTNTATAAASTMTLMMLGG